MNDRHMDYQNPALAPEQRAELLLGELSVREKLAQLTGWLSFASSDAAQVAERFPYGLGQVSTLQMRACETAEDAAQMQRAIQRAVMDASPHHIPAIFHMEGLCGAFVQDTTSLPSGIGRASGWDPELEEKLGALVGRQERALGVTNTLAPVLDVSRDSRMGRQGETYGEDPTLAAALGAAYTKGVQGEGPDGRRTDAVAKHFLGFHAGAAGIHGADTQISPRELREVYGKPFQAAIAKSGLKGVMPCYCSLNGVPVSANGEIMNDLLRGEMGFDGVVVSDYSAIHNIHAVQHVGETPLEAGLMALAGGLDVELPNPQCYNEDMAAAFESGAADIANTGARDGEEIVQLYVRDRFACVTRPNLELAGFARVRLRAGERKAVRFTLDMSQLAFLDRAMAWRVEAGDVDVLVGRSSADLRCEGSFRVAGTRTLEGRDREFWAQVEIR